jgi:phosphotriesterase-related protein
MHEHIFANTLIEDRATGLLVDYHLMTQELAAFSAVGGRTIVDLTTAEITSGASPDPTGRYRGVPSTGYPENGSRSTNNVLALAQIAGDTGLQIVLGTGHYRDPFLDRSLFDRFGVQRLTERIVGDLTDGFPGTDVRAGIIGEIGSDKWYISALEERSFRAAARAQMQTGVALSTHASRWPVGIDQLDILVAEGADPARVIIGHCDTINIPEYHEDVAARGAFVQFDTIRGNTDYDTRMRVGFVVNLARKGLLGQVLLSHDVCLRTHLHISGGGGYDFIPGPFAVALKDAGLDSDDIEQLLVDNPRRALAGP